MNDELSQRVIGAAFNVHNQLGFGFLESVYEKALSIELTKLAISHQLQSPVQVLYDKQVVGDFEMPWFTGPVIMRVRFVGTCTAGTETEA